MIWITSQLKWRRTNAPLCCSYFYFLKLLVCLNMVQFIVKLAYQIVFWFNKLIGFALVLFQVVIMTQLQLSHQPLGDQKDAWLNCFWWLLGCHNFSYNQPLSSMIVNSVKWDIISIYVCFVIPVVKAFI